jgi:prepilin-type N-terminal cleavage/methylation domain-containing protein
MMLVNTLSKVYHEYMLGRGFTLIELLVVTAIILIIVSSVSIVVVGGFQRRRDADRIAHLALVQSVLEFYIAEHGDFDVILSSDGAVTSHNGQSFTESVYYSTPTYPSAVPGKHPWTVLNSYTVKYSNDLPVDPLNKYATWTATGDPDYSNEGITQGYILVRLRSINVDQLSGCSGAGYSDEYVAGYIIETALESKTHRASNRLRESRLFGCVAETDPLTHKMQFWGTIK